VSLGSNLGDRVAHLRLGLSALRDHLEDPSVSSVYETAPVGLENQPVFLNACCVGRTRLGPRQLLSELLDAERRAGRQRPGPRQGPRTLDLDLLLYADLVQRTEYLTVPHPRVRERAFVLVPLAEIAADWQIPASGGEEAATVAELADRIERDGIRRTDLEL
jgi:2-amino-4-hydroxy-6-hydroxymethyldihydropteridine diphosphokinase